MGPCQNPYAPHAGMPSPELAGPVLIRSQCALKHPSPPRATMCAPRQETKHRARCDNRSAHRCAAPFTRSSKKSWPAFAKPPRFQVHGHGDTD